MKGRARCAVCHLGRKGHAVAPAGGVTELEQGPELPPRSRCRSGMRRSCPFVLAAIATIAGVIAIAAPARAADSADACVTIHSAELTSGLAFDVKNTCDKRLACALSWTLTCENASGKTTSKSKQEARFVISSSDTHHTTGSAASCKDGWKIDDVSWDCAPSVK
jgi:hypothetical protein